MTSVSRTGAIAAPPDAVWDVLADFGAIVVWAPDVDHSCLLTEQVTGIGAARRIQAGRTTLVETVTEWSPPAADQPGVMAYRIEGLPKIVRSLTNRWVLTPSDTGTSIVLTTTVDAGPRPPQQLIARLVGRRLAAASDDMIAGLTTHVTDSQPAPSADTEIQP